MFEIAFKDIRGTFKGADELFDTLLEQTTPTGREIVSQSQDPALRGEAFSESTLNSLGMGEGRLTDEEAAISRSIASASKKTPVADLKKANADWYERVKAFANVEDV